MRLLLLARQLLKPFYLYHVLKRGIHAGMCSVCGDRTLFVKTGNWLRDQYICICCLSIPRGRALFHVLREQFPNWRQLAIHESSPVEPTFSRFASECANYLPSHFFPAIPCGSLHHGFRCEDLARQTFPDASFDMVITQDVLEHLLDPCAAFREIARTLKPGGAHLFTVPWYYWQDTRVRARQHNGAVEYVETAEYHGNPVDAQGALVVTEWGRDLCDTIYVSSAMTTTSIRIFDPRLGIEGEFVDVFVSRKTDDCGRVLLDRWGKVDGDN